MSAITQYTLMIFVAAVGVTGQLLLKKGIGTYSHLQFNNFNFFSKILSVALEPLISIALICYALGMVGYLFLLSKVELTIVYPVCTSLTFVGITFFGWFILKEPFNLFKIIGIVFIVIGIILIEKFS